MGKGVKCEFRVWVFLRVKKLEELLALRGQHFRNTRARQQLAVLEELLQQLVWLRRRTPHLIQC